MHESERDIYRIYHHILLCMKKCATLYLTLPGLYSATYDIVESISIIRKRIKTWFLISQIKENLT